MARRQAMRRAQAWVELLTEDPEAVSALTTARAHLPAARSLRGLRRVRLFELEGSLPGRGAIEALLHRSIQFYNPHKERCRVRLKPEDPTPLAAGEWAVLVYDRGETRREGAERWWRHETGKVIEVREGVVWMLAFEPAVGDTAAAVQDLAVLRDRRHGLLCNPHAQEHRWASQAIPVPWLEASR
jgi:hypothetical protein